MKELRQLYGGAGCGDHQHTVDEFLLIGAAAATHDVADAGREIPEEVLNRLNV